MKIRLYLDEDSMRDALVIALRARGVEVLTALEAAMIDRSDSEHLDYATAQGCSLFSFNVKDYYDLHTNRLAAGISHRGIILARKQVHPVGELMRRLLRLIGARSGEEMKDRVEFLSPWG
jgi:hypothetical protein